MQVSLNAQGNDYSHSSTNCCFLFLPHLCLQSVLGQLCLYFCTYNRALVLYRPEVIDTGSPNKVDSKLFGADLGFIYLGGG